MKLLDDDDPPPRLVFGAMVHDLALGITRERLATSDAWQDASRAAEHAVPAPS